MTGENWKYLKEIVGEVLNLPPAKRKGFLDNKNLSLEMRAEVESLMAFDEASENFLNVSAVTLSRDFIAFGEAEVSLAGQQIGSYKIISELGIGGMGAVYLGERIDGKFEQKVAIKMLKREFNSERIRRSFGREKDFLAKLSHPNIAMLLDTGTTDDGIPYLVMEYVDGIPIDKFCLENLLKLNSILKLFNEVCGAVGFAHQNLIVHRDLKPSNILVTSDGKPKLLDFGISKLLDDENEEQNSNTILGAMTPEYASPEQIKGENVTTATDIYSLGMVLFKMITGKYPYNFDGISSQKIFKEITEIEAKSPSESDVLNNQISTNHLKGDIDNIVAKALSKDPERRYKTVEQFSTDIWRFIDGIPVSARPATFTYRANKFFRRNKIPVIAEFLIAFSLLAGIAVAVWQAKVSIEQAEIAVKAQAKAEIENEKAQKISKFMSKVISYANPTWYAEGSKFNGETKVIEAMNDLGEKIDIEFAGEPDVQAELHHKFAEVYHFNGGSLNKENQKEKEKFHAKQALKFRKQFYGEKHELVAKDLFYLREAGEVESGEANDENFAKMLARAIQMMRETNPKNLNLPYMLEAYANRLSFDETANLHEIYRRNVIPPTTENKYQIAEKYYAEMLDLFHFHYKEENQAIAATNCYMANALLKQNKSAEAEPYYQICKRAEDNPKYQQNADTIRKMSKRIEEMMKANSR
jgi:eukaryotic-like serine/threonine-protein kinase